MFHRLRVCISLAFKLLRVNIQTIYGVWKIANVPEPNVSIFGGARFKLDDPYAKQAHKLANMLVANGISVFTGGGKGVMEAANCGAIENSTEARSVGIGVRDLGEGRNPCVQIYFVLDYFFARKWLLTRYSEAFFVFPGGFGTLDELAEVLTLLKTNKLEPVPIVLIGQEFWQPFMDWLSHEALKHGTVSQKELALFSITDDLQEALCTARDACREQFHKM